MTSLSIPTWAALTLICLIIAAAVFGAFLLAVGVEYVRMQSGRPVRKVQPSADEERKMFGLCPNCGKPYAEPTLVKN